MDLFNYSPILETAAQAEEENSESGMGDTEMVKMLVRILHEMVVGNKTGGDTASDPIASMLNKREM